MKRIMETNRGRYRIDQKANFYHIDEIDGRGDKIALVEKQAIADMIYSERGIIVNTEKEVTRTIKRLISAYEIETKRRMG
jgi:hypothetical protein